MEHVETDLYVYCSDSFLLKKLQRLVFIEEAGEQKFSMNQLLPLPSGYSGVPNYQIYGHHWRRIVWGASQDGTELGKYIDTNRFDVSFTTPRVPALIWFETFCKMSERLYKDSGIIPKPELVIFYAYGIFDTRNQGFVFWEPGGKLEIYDTFQEEWRSILDQVFNDKRFEYYRGETWN